LKLETDRIDADEGTSASFIIVSYLCVETLTMRCWVNTFAQKEKKIGLDIPAITAFVHESARETNELCIALDGRKSCFGDIDKVGNV